MPRKYSLVLILASLAFSGCATHAPAPAARRVQAIEANHRGTALFQRGDYAGAVGQYRRALEIERSIEHEDGVAANLINLSIAYQRLGEREAARAAVAEILDRPLLAFPPRRIAEAALRDAILKVDAGDAEGAGRSLERARAACAAPCALNGKLFNMDAQLAFSRHDYAAARDSATRALAANRERADREEAANSLRLLGAVSLEDGTAPAGEPALREALDIDKDLALPPRILRDLILLGRAALARTDADQARSYFGRALSVAQAMRDQNAIAEITSLMQRVASAPPAR